VSALLHRARTGEGQFIDVGMMEATAMLAGDAFLEFTRNDVIATPLGNRHRAFAPHGIYATLDGWIAIGVESEEQWSGLRALVEDDRLDDDDFASMASRKAHEDRLDEILAGWTGELRAEACERALQGARVPAARVRHRGEVLDHPALVSRGFGVDVDFPEAGTHRAAGIPWQFAVTPLAVTRPSPLFGEHTFEVLSAIGMSRAEYEQLVERGVLDGTPGS